MLSATNGRNTLILITPFHPHSNSSVCLWWLIFQDSSRVGGVTVASWKMNDVNWTWLIPWIIYQWVFLLNTIVWRSWPHNVSSDVWRDHSKSGTERAFLGIGKTENLINRIVFVSVSTTVNFYFTVFKRAETFPSMSLNCQKAFLVVLFNRKNPAVQKITSGHPFENDGFWNPWVHHQ